MLGSREGYGLFVCCTVYAVVVCSGLGLDHLLLVQQVLWVDNWGEGGGRGGEVGGGRGEGGGGRGERGEEGGGRGGLKYYAAYNTAFQSPELVRKFST